MKQDAIPKSQNGATRCREVISLERIDDSSIAINGGLTEGGLDLVTDDRGIFYAIGLDDAKNWYEIGEATVRVENGQIVEMIRVYVP